MPGAQERAGLGWGCLRIVTPNRPRAHGAPGAESGSL